MATFPLDKFLSQAKQLNLSKRTVETRYYSLVPFRDFLAGREITLESTQEYIAQLSSGKLAPASLDNYIKNIRAFINFLELPFAKKLLRPRLHRQPLDIIPSELAEKVIIAGTGDSTIRLCLRLILRTGLRLSEALSLKAESFNFEEETFSVKGKGGDFETLPVPKDLIPQLRLLKPGRLFPHTPKTLNKALKRGGRKLGLTQNMHVHLLRHIFATSLLKSGVSLQIVSRILRHKNILLTDRIYSSYVIGDLAQALNSQVIIQEGLTTEQVFDSVEKSIRALIDKRFKLGIERGEKTLIIKLFEDDAQEHAEITK